MYFGHSLSFPLYVYFSFVKAEISNLKSYCKINPLLILVIRPDGGWSFLAETYRFFPLEYTIVVTDCNICVNLIMQWGYATLKYLEFDL